MRLSEAADQEIEMPKPGRNDPCPCGSNRKAKRCCGQTRGPSADDLARAHLAQLARQAAPDLLGLSDRALDHLWEGLMDLPGVDYSLLVTLPKLIGPNLQRLREANDDPDWGWDALTAVKKRIDTPQQRALLADAIVRLRDQHRINRRQAAYALLDLSTQSTRLVAASLLEAVAVSTGASRTPGGLHIAA
jgi:hypothetical protein